MRAQRGKGFLHVRDALVDVEEAEQLEGAVPFRLGLVGDVDAGLDAPEEIGTEREKTLLGERVAGVAHHLVHAEDLLGDEDPGGRRLLRHDDVGRSEEHTSELQSLMRISYAVFCLKKNNQITLQ